MRARWLAVPKRVASVRLGIAAAQRAALVPGSWHSFATAAGGQVGHHSRLQCGAVPVQFIPTARTRGRQQHEEGNRYRYSTTNNNRMACSLAISGGVVLLAASLPGSTASMEPDAPVAEVAMDNSGAGASSPANKLQQLVDDVLMLVHEAIQRIMVLLARAVDGATDLLAQLRKAVQSADERENSEQESLGDSAVPTEALASAAAPAKEAEVEAEEQSFYKRYGYIIIGCSILGSHRSQPRVHACFCTRSYLAHVRVCAYTHTHLCTSLGLGGGVGHENTVRWKLT
jgi:hypothetical protein